MFDQETWRFINTFAPWFSAIGSTAAVILSLYLAWRSSRAKIKVSVSIMTETGEPHRDFLIIKGVNAGFRETTITGIEWKILWPSPKNFAVVPPAADLFSSTLPAKIGYSDTVRFAFLDSEFQKSAETLLTRLRKRRGLWLSLRRTRLGVYSSIGEEFLTPLDHEMRKWLRDHVERPGTTSDPAKEVPPSSVS